MNESKCTGCGVCLNACPSGAPVMMLEREEQSLSELVIAWRGKKGWKTGDFATLLNRRGEGLGSGRVLEVMDAGRLRVEVPTHLLWETRAVKPVRLPSAADEGFLENMRQEFTQGEKADISLNGERRLVAEGGTVSRTLYATGHARGQDSLYCSDGSCGLCEILVDGNKRLACQTGIRRGMTVKSLPSPEAGGADDLLCPCLGLTMAEVIERLKQGKLRSPEAVLSVVHVGEGRCKGRLCMDAFRRVLDSQGLDSNQWTDWRFPWSEWLLTRS